MPKYLVKGNYTTEGVAGLKKEGGTSRRDAVAKALSAVGGSIESFYYAFGDVDVYVVVELPDNAACAAFALEVNAAGGVTLETVVLLTPEELDAGRGKESGYRAPGA